MATAERPHSSPPTDSVSPGRQPAAYGRGSTIDQPVEPQLTRCIQAARQHGLTIPEEHLYSDSGVSGASDSRPGLDRLRAAIVAGLILVVFATKLDRVARSVRTAIEFFDLCETHGVRIVVVDQAIDSASPAGRLLRTLLAAIAEFELELIRDRTRSAMSALKSGARLTRSGRPVGRPRVLTAAKAEQVADLTRQGLSARLVAQHAGLKLGTVRWVRYCQRKGLDPIDKARRSKRPVAPIETPSGEQPFPSPKGEP